jgi:hypothetical protein
VISISSANDRLPPSAISAGALIVCADGRSAIQKKRRDFEGGQRHPQQLQPRPFQPRKIGAMPPDHRRQHDQRRAGAQPQQLPDRVGRDHELSERVAEREHEDRQQHQPDSGQPRGTLVGRGRYFGEDAHGRPQRFHLLASWSGKARSASSRQASRQSTTWLPQL